LSPGRRFWFLICGFWLLNGGRNRFPNHPPRPVPKSKTSKRRSPISRSAWARIRLFAMDVDGILTDGTVRIASDGTETKTFSILDGLGLVRCRDAGIALAWISGRPSPATTARATELRIPHLIQGCTDKLAALRQLAQQLGLEAAQVCYMGDDDVDVAALQWAGISVTVPGAMPAAVAAANVVTNRVAGRGAVREVAEHLLRARV
jgi:3-deoxy-D-manno-octulosonate 8-phosphate phosphatase (KDO 8-P phosphatase)